MLSRYFAKTGIKIQQFFEDADTLIVNTIIKLALIYDSAEIFGLNYRIFKGQKNIFFRKPPKGYTRVTHYTLWIVSGMKDLFLRTFFSIMLSAVATPLRVHVKESVCRCWKTGISCSVQRQSYYIFYKSWSKLIKLSETLRRNIKNFVFSVHMHFQMYILTGLYSFLVIKIKIFFCKNVTKFTTLWELRMITHFSIQFCKLIIIMCSLNSLSYHKTVARPLDPKQAEICWMKQKHPV